MNTQQAYIEGFVKRANEYGFNENEAIELLNKIAFSPSYEATQNLHKSLPNPFQYSTPVGNRNGRAYVSSKGHIGSFSQTPQGISAAGAPKPASYQGSFVQKLVSGNPFERTAAPVPAVASAPTRSPAPAAVRPSVAASPQPTQTAQSSQPVQQQAAPSIMRMAAPQSSSPAAVAQSFSPQLPAAQTQVAAPAASPQQQAGPSNEYLAKVMGSYNPNSRLDRAKADAIRQMYHPGMKASEIYANQAYQQAGRAGSPVMLAGR